MGKDASLKDTHKILDATGPRAEAVTWKGIQTPILIPENLPEEQKRAELMGTNIQAAAIWGSFFYHLDNGTGKCQFGILPLIY